MHDSAPTSRQIQDAVRTLALVHRVDLPGRTSASALVVPPLVSPDIETRDQRLLYLIGQGVGTVRDMMRETKWRRHLINPRLVVLLREGKIRRSPDIGPYVQYFLPGTRQAGNLSIVSVRPSGKPR